MTCLDGMNRYLENLFPGTTKTEVVLSGIPGQVRAYMKGKGGKVDQKLSQ